MSSPWKKQPEDVVDSVLKRAEVSKVSRGDNRPTQIRHVPVPFSRPLLGSMLVSNSEACMADTRLDCTQTAEPLGFGPVQD